MPANELVYLLVWPFALWLLGWAVLPLSRRLFAAFPDSGLAIGRLLLVVLSTLLAFWGAACHMLPLRFSPVILFGAAIAAALAWRQAPLRTWAQQHRRPLLISDAIFFAAFAFFILVRLRHPEAGDLEKPMDMALLAAARRADFLPFENFWYAGSHLTNYYYFGPLMASILARSFATPAWFAYNLALATFSTFFLSVLWSVCAAVTGSNRWGLMAMLLVALGGHFEPLRQIATAHKLWPLNWWTTSRVIENTINEYPAFTLLIGDAHAHFYAFSLSALFFGLCYNLISAPTAKTAWITLTLCGVVLSTTLLTNTWDAPLYVLLLILSTAFMPNFKRRSQTNLLSEINSDAAEEITSSNLKALILRLTIWLKSIDWRHKLPVFGVVGFCPLLAAPYFLRFHAQVHGAVWDPWLPDRLSFFLLWGGWWLLTIPAFLLHGVESENRSAASTRFSLALGGIGLLALVAPYLMYINGPFGGALRYQDTVFKFGLQAWLLLGTAIGCGLGSGLRIWLPTAPLFQRWGAAYLGAVMVLLLMLAPAAVLWARTVESATRDSDGKTILSLNAMYFLPPGEQDAVRWLTANVPAGATMLEPTGNDYDAMSARFSTFTGIPTYVGWGQHVWFWGEDPGKVEQRKKLVNAFYSVPDSKATADILKAIRPTYVIFPNPPRQMDGSLDPSLQETIAQSGQLIWSAGTPTAREFPLIIRTR